MSDTIWDEIMRSPLDPDPDETRNWPAFLAPIALASVAGLTIGMLLGGAGPVPETTLPPPIAPTAKPVPAPDPIFPNGYTEADGVGLKALAVFSRHDSLFVVVNSATRSDLNRVETNEFHIADWVLVGDGMETIASRALMSRLAPGVRLVEFPGVAALPAATPQLQVREATEMTVRTGCNGCAAFSVDAAEGELVIDALPLPYTMAEPLFIAVAGGVNLAIEELQITDEWGYLRWRIIDTNDARLRVTPRIIFDGTDDLATAEVDPTQLIPDSVRGINQQNPLGSNAEPFTRQGTIGLDRIGEIMSADNRPEQVVLRWNVEWQHPVGDPVVLPLDDLVDLGTID